MTLIFFNNPSVYLISFFLIIEQIIVQPNCEIQEGFIVVKTFQIKFLSVPCSYSYPPFHHYSVIKSPSHSWSTVTQSSINEHITARKEDININ